MREQIGAPDIISERLWESLQVIMYSPASPWAPVHNKITRLCWYKVGVKMRWVLKYEEKTK